MALKNLTLAEMVEVSDAWTTTTDGGHQALLRQPRLAALLPDVQRVHDGLVQLTPATQDSRRTELASLAAEQDDLHDTLARGIHGLLTHLALLADDGAALLQLRDKLMPAGLGKALQAVPLPNSRNLDQTVTAWLDAGDRLGQLEMERARLEERDGSSFAEQSVAARNKWIRVVNALVNLSELAELAPDAEQLIFGPLRDAEAKAEQRAARRSAQRVASPSS